MDEKERYNQVAGFLNYKKPKSLEDAFELLKTKGYVKSDGLNKTYMGSWLDYCFDGDETRLRELLGSSGELFCYITIPYRKSGIGSHHGRISPKLYDDITSESPEGIAYINKFGSNTKFKWNVMVGEPKVTEEFFSLKGGTLVPPRPEMGSNGSPFEKDRGSA